MSLEGAKIICLNADEDGKFETISANGKSFKFGYYMDCDVVLEHPDAMGEHCVISCDAFGRVTIENRCSDQLITLDGKSLVKMRPLLHNTEICILDKKYLWHFDGTPSRGFIMEDTNDFTTPKQIKKPQQPPNSEPARKWGRPLQKRLTIHSFAYCIKAGESPVDVLSTSDENKPLNTYDITEADIVPSKKMFPSPPPAEISNFIDLNTPKFEQSSCSGRLQTLSGCKLSETVITSYSPRETGIRQEKSFAIVQSPLAASYVKTVADVSLGSFHHNVSPQIIQNNRPSMHLIDLMTPKKLKPPASSPSRTLLKSTLKRNIPKGTSPQTPQKLKKLINVSTPGSSNTVYSVRSTDDESVIILSDDCSDSSSPITKTPPRARTPQSLMKRAILSSAKKVAVKKCLNQTGSKQTYTPMTSTNPTSVRLQSQSTPQRKSFEKCSSSAESLSVGKTRRSLVTSTPFRRRIEIVSPSASRRSLVLSSQSSGAKKESRNSLMLKQALSISSMTPKRKSVSCIKNQTEVRKSVSFLQHVEKEEKEKVNELDKITANESLNDTFTIEYDDNNVIKSGQGASSYRKDVTFSPKKDKLSLSPQNLSIQTPSSTPELVPECKSSLKSGLDLIISCSEKPIVTDESKDQAELTRTSPLVSHVETLSDDRMEINTNFHEKQSLQCRKHLSKIDESVKVKHIQNTREQKDYDFDGVDEIFKTPKAKNVMILSSPKSVSLQKASSDSVELIHSTEFNLSSNLDILFQTPQSEFITRRVDSATPNTADPIEALPPEEDFDVVVDRQILKKSYAPKTPPKKLQTLQTSSDPNLPKTDIEEWIDNVNDLLEIPPEEDEMSYLTATMNDISRDPLMTHSVPKSSNTNKKMQINTRIDEFEMTMTEEDENKSLSTVLKDPLDPTVPRSLSPNISGISLLDHTSESIFSETLALSDDTSIKETDKSTKPSEENHPTNSSNNQKQLNESQEEKARREIEEAFKNFEKQRKAVDEKRLSSTPEAKKPSISIFGKSMVNQVLDDPTFDLKAIKADQHVAMSNEKHDLENRKAKSLVKIPEPKKVALKDHRRTLGSALVSEVKLDLQAAKAERELELAFENFEDEPEFSEQRVVKTPEPKKVALKDHRGTLGSALMSEVKLDLQAAKAERELELAFENFEEEPEFSEQRVVKTPEPKKVALKDHRRTLGSALVSEVKLDLQAAKAERELELAFENFKEEPEFSEQRVVKTPEPKKVSLKDHRRTLGSALVSEVKLDLQAAKAERELKLAFENFEEEPEFSEQRVVQTPEPKKVALKDQRRTLGSTLVSEVKLDLQAAKAELELELAFENFEEEPEFSEQRVVKTPEPKKVFLKDHRRTLGSALVSEVKLDLQAAKAERELELAFENFEEEPEFSEQRVVKTPEPKKVALKDHKRTLGSALVSEVKLDLQAAKAERELELAFENFEEEPEFSEQRVVKTPEAKKVSLKDHRRTLGSALVSEVKLDLQAAKAERELELAFENFEEEPEFSEQRVVKTPEPKKVSLKDHRRTLGSALVSQVKLDLQAAKAERELELAFENFEEEPEFSEQRVVKTPEPKKVALKDHRRTLGSALVSEVKLDLQAAKAERELELAFENFKEEPEFSEQRVVKTPEPKKVALKDHRRTLGSALVSEVKLDLQAAKAERELELAFENFEEEPEFSEQRVVKTPEPKKIALKDHRRTLGSALVSEVKLDLQAAKAERELELAFENFEEEPEFSEQRVVKTPEPKKVSLKDHRRTLGSALVSEVKLDLQAAKAERELELAFENFEEEPEFSEQRVVKTPEPKKVSLKDHRRTLGSALVSEVKLDLQAARAERELELAFENFEEEPEFSEQRVVKTPEPKKVSLKDHRRTLGSALVSEVKLDLQAAKAERELELAFENFKEEPEFSEQRVVKTPEPKKVLLKDHRRTLGSALVSEVKLDLQAAKAERELELAFENFEEEPEFLEQRVVKTPEAKKVSLKDHRRTLGSALVSEVKLDLQAAKAERELELAFENFEEEPEFSEQRVVKTPEAKKVSLKDHRRTLGSALVSEVKLDLQAAKAERELELAFENFEEEPEFSEQRVVKTPEAKKVSLKDHRRTLGSALVSEVKLDLQAAKAERELELAFENFEEEPEFSEQRVVKTPEAKKVSLKDHRRTLGSALVSEVKLDLQAAKAERELELAFENFEEEPEFSEQRVVKTPEPKKVSLKDHRRTLGSALVSEMKLDLQAAKAERELELAFENFKEEPEFSEQRVVKTPETKKVALKDHRRTLGSALVSEMKLDLQAAKAERELELAFENFEEEPEFSEQRVIKTPEAKKVSLKDHRRTLGSALVSEVKLDLQAAKAKRELELAFENFEDEPKFSEQRVVKTPEPKKVSLKDHRRTLGSTLVSEVKLDLQAAKAERELELAFENFEEEPEFSEQRVVKTPEAKKVSLKDHRRTLGSALVSEVKLDLQAAKAERELELAFENFEEEPEFSEQRVVKTPEAKKVSLKDHRRTLGSALVSEVKLDLQAAKAERELELAFENFEEDPEFSEQRVVKTPEPKKVALKDHRRTLGSALVSEVKLDLQAAKVERELEMAFENESTEISSQPFTDTIIENKNCEMISFGKDATKETNDSDGNICPNDSNLPNKKFITLKSSKSGPKTTDEDYRLKSNLNALEQSEATNSLAKNKIIKKPVVRRTRRKQNDSVDDLESSVAKESMITFKNKVPQTRRRRQKSIDLLNDDTTTASHVQKKASAATRNDGESLQTSTHQIGSSDVDTTEDESNKGTEHAHILAPIDKEANSKISNQDIEPKSLITLRAETDEIISSSPITARSRIRGRKAQLNVVLIESKDSNTSISGTKSSNEEYSKNKNIKINENGNSKIEYNNDVDEFIPCRRKPSKIKESAHILPAAIRRTRKGSVQQDLEVQTSDDIEADDDEADIVPSTPLEKKTRLRQGNRKASSTLAQVDPENTKAKESQEFETENLIKNRIGGRRLAKITDYTDEDSIKKNATQDDRFMLKDVEISSPECKSMNIKDVTLAISQNKTAEIASNREVGRSKANVVFQEKLESKNKNENKNVPLTTRGRRAAAKLENEVTVVKSGQQRTTEQIIEPQLLIINKNEKDVKLNIQDDCQIDKNDELVADVEKFITPEPEAFIKTSEITQTTVCRDESQYQEHLLNDEDDISKTDKSLSSLNLRSQEIQNRNQAETDAGNNIPTRKRGGRAAVKSDEVVSAPKSSRNAIDEQISKTPQLEKTEILQEAVELNVQDRQLDSINQEKKRKYAVVEQTITPVPANKRGRKATSKIEPTVSSPVISAPVRRNTRRKPVEDPILKKEEAVTLVDEDKEKSDNEEAPINQLSLKTRSHEDTFDLMPIKHIIESSTPIRRGSRRNVQRLPESNKNSAEVHEEAIESSPATRRGKRTRGINVQNALMESNDVISKSAGNKANQGFDVVDRVKCLEHNIESAADKSNTASHTEPHPIKSEPLSTESSLLTRKTRQKRGAVVELCKDKNESHTEPHPIKSEPLSTESSLLTRKTRQKRGAVEELCNDKNESHTEPHPIKSETPSTENSLLTRKTRQKRGAVEELCNDKNESHTEPHPIKSETPSTENSLLTRKTRQKRGAVEELCNDKNESHTEPHPIKSETPSTENSLLTRKTRQKRGAVEELCNDKNESHTEPYPIKSETSSTENSLLTRKTRQKRGAVEELCNDKNESHTEPHPIKSETPSTENSLLTRKTRQKRGAVEELCNDKIESESVNERSTTDADILEIVSAKKRTRKTPLKLAEFVVSSLVQQIKTEILNNDSTQENSTPVLKRSRRAVVKNDHQNESALSCNQDLQNDAPREFDSNEDKTEEIHKGKSTRRIRAFSETTTPATAVSEELKSEFDGKTQNKSTRGRGRAQLKTNSKLESTSNTEEEQSVMDGSENCVPSELVPTKCGQLTTVKLETDEFTQEDSTPTQKRGCRAIAKSNTQKDLDLPRRVGRQLKTKDEATLTLNKDVQSNKNENNISCNLVAAEDKTEEHSKERPNRRGRAFSKATSPSIPKSDDQQVEIEGKTQNQPIRGRGRVPLKKNPTFENTSNTEEEHTLPTTKQRSTRGRKAATKTESGKEIAQDKIPDAELTANSKLETNHNKDKDTIDISPKKDRKAAAAEPVTKTTRGRKAVVKNMSEESDRPEPEKDSKSALKRRNLEILTDVNQEDTPSKRTRRKPNKFISDEFVP